MGIGTNVVTSYPITISGSAISLNTITSVDGFNVKKIDTWPHGLYTPAINIEAINSPVRDYTLLRTGWLDTLSGSYGFTIKHLYTRTGNNKSLSIFTDNQTSVTQIEAITLLQDGKLGILHPSASYELHVNGDIGADYVYSTSSWSNKSISASHAVFADTASYVAGSVISGSVASASYAETSSWALNWNSASILSLIDNKQDTLVTGSTYPITSSWSNNTISASHAIQSDSASYYGGSVASSSYADFSVSSSYVSGTVVVPGDHKDILLNDNGFLGRTSSFFYNEERAFSIYGTTTEPAPVTGGLYVNFSDGRLKFCVEESWLYTFV